MEILKWEILLKWRNGQKFSAKKLDFILPHEVQKLVRETSVDVEDGILGCLRPILGLGDAVG